MRKEIEGKNSFLQNRVRSSDDTSDSLANRLYIINESYWFYSNIFVLTVGLIGNLVLILILITLRVFRGNQCAFLLMIESISNIGFLLFTSPMPTRPYFRQISSLKLAHRLTGVNVCFALLHGILIIIFIDIVQVRACALSNNVLALYFTYFYYPILNALGSLMVTVTFSLLAYQNVRRIIRRQINVDRRRLDRQLTAMILARVWFLILVGLPSIGFSILRLNFSVNDVNQLKVAIITLVGSITYSVLYANFAIE